MFVKRIINAALASPSFLASLLALAVISHSHGEPVVTNEKVFFVPFNVPYGAPEALPKLVELFVSADRGKTWHPYQKRPPKDGRFSFNAGGDGVYYFATRTVNQNGQAVPEEVGQPELVVVVDRSQPGLEATANETADGRIELTWNANDSNLAPDLTSIRYQIADGSDPNAGTWHPVDIRANSKLMPGGKLTGVAALWPPAGAKRLRFQVVAKDRAGNQATIDREVTLGSPAGATATAAAGPTGATGAMADPFAMLQSPNAGAQPPVATAGPIPPIPSGGPLSNSPNGNGNAWTSEQAGAAPAPYTTDPTAWGNAGIQIQPQPPVGNAAHAPTSSPAPSLPAAQSNELNGPNPAFASAGIHENMRVSKSRRFYLDYEIESGGPSDVYRVEVWMTADGGRTWKHAGDDEDRVSPYLVDAPSDGVLGFRLIVQSKEGLAARPPQSGDPPDLWVRVDATPPTAVLRTATFGRGEDLGTMNITWDVRDNDLIEQPVSIAYSSTPDGPWRQIASQIPNTGRYVWRLDDRAPSRIYLRLEAVDHAGNMGVDVLRDPIDSSGVMPRGVIRQVRPAP